MNAMLSVQKVRQEARLMFSLIDAFECSQRQLSTPVAATLTRWRDAKKRVDASGDYEKEATVFHEILTDLEQSGAFSETWIEPRWRAAQSRIAEKE